MDVKDLMPPNPLSLVIFCAPDQLFGSPPHCMHMHKSGCLLIISYFSCCGCNAPNEKKKIGKFIEDAEVNFWNTCFCLIYEGEMQDLI
jgi:hypothetical protein